MAGHLFLAFTILCLSIAITSAELQRFHHPAKGDGSLSFLVVGDWGRKGEYNQSRVAHQMGKIGEKMDIDFVISTGDNFYDDGLTDVHDPAFEESFTKIYTADSLQKPWYTVLGNHDYRGDAEAQLSSVLRTIDSRWICSRSFIVDAELAEIFFVDTTPLIKSYYTDYEHTYDWRGIVSRETYTENLLKELESALSKSIAKWKIVVGHHAIRSIGYHGDTKELIKMLLPILQSYNVDFYMNGHDHCLEQITDSDSPIQFFTSGAGSKAWRGDLTEQDKQVKFFYDGQGFMSVHLTPAEAETVFYDVDGKILHRWNKSQQLHLSM